MEFRGWLLCRRVAGNLPDRVLEALLNGLAGVVAVSGTCGGPGLQGGDDFLVFSAGEVLLGHQVEVTFDCGEVVLGNAEGCFSGCCAAGMVEEFLECLWAYHWALLAICPCARGAGPWTCRAMGHGCLRWRGDCCFLRLVSLTFQDPVVFLFLGPFSPSVLRTCGRRSLTYISVGLVLQLCR